MPKSIPALVKRHLLRWARDSSGLSVPSAAQKAKVRADDLDRWEEGEGHPTVAQLRKLANVYKRSLAAFYLPHPPAPLLPLDDFRRLPTAARPLSPELRLAHRQAVYRRRLALELLEQVGEAPPVFGLAARLTDDPEEAGARLRSSLGITTDQQASWGAPYEALTAWRGACEAQGVLVFQAPRVDPHEMSGFSVGEHPLPVIVVNISDFELRRVFTLLHEIVHLATKRGGLCELDESPGRGADAERLEVFCNRVAGATLVPLDALSGEELVQGQRGHEDWSDADLGALARRFSASREVILRRLLIAGLTTPEFYSAKRDEFQRAYEDGRARRGGGPVPEHTKALSRSGHFFTELVLRSYHQERITTADVAEYLGLRAKHLPKLEERVFGS